MSYNFDLDSAALVANCQDGLMSKRQCIEFPLPGSSLYLKIEQSIGKLLVLVRRTAPEKTYPMDV